MMLGSDILNRLYCSKSVALLIFNSNGSVMQPCSPVFPVTRMRKKIHNLNRSIDES